MQRVASSLPPGLIYHPDFLSPDEERALLAAMARIEFGEVRMHGFTAKRRVAEPDELAQVVVTQYPPGAAIGWHRDAAAFGATVIAVSLGASCRMRLRRSSARNAETAELALAPRSAYLLGGEVRRTWQHSIPLTPELRYSITFRTLAAPAKR
jgi:hypothetical protein